MGLSRYIRIVFNMFNKIAPLAMAALSAFADNSHLLKNLPLSTDGSKIVDTENNMVRLACVNWYGAHMERYVVNGLDLQSLDDMSQMIADQGFNCVRLPYSLEQFYKDPVVEYDAVSANPDLMGLTAMQVFDKTVESLTNAGVAVILNNHMSDAAWCCSDTDGNGLWHNDNYTADQWQEAVASISERYGSNLLVIGNDLRNEIRDDLNNGLYESWDTGRPKTNWKLAATNCGNEVLRRTPNQLVIIEGLNYANKMSMIRDSPITLDMPNKLVYSFHLYSWQYVTSYDSYEEYVAGLNDEVAFILEEGQSYTTPLWLGEFGTNS